MNKLIIIRGIPGSGKSTFSKVFNHYNVFEFDDYFYDISQSPYEQGQRMFNDVKESLKKDTTIVVNVFMKVESMQQYIDLAKEMECDLVVIRTTDRFNNVHNVSERQVTHCKENFEDYDGEILICQTRLSH